MATIITIEAMIVIEIFTNLSLQFLLPLLVAGIANASIYCKLKERLETYTTRNNNSKRMQDVLRMKRTCKLLVSMVTIFLFCWLPLSFFNLTLSSIRAAVPDNKDFFTLFGTCHLIGMTSACTNPVLYGFLNESFKKEFKEMLRMINVNQKSAANNLENPITLQCGPQQALLPNNQTNNQTNKQTNNQTNKLTNNQTNQQTNDQID